MTGVLDGIRVLDLTQWAMGPVAGGVLADWGATVFKVEHPETGDPMRGLVSTGLVGDATTDVNFMWEIPNRGKRGLGIDLAQPEGQRIVHELAATCDVFLTSFLTDARRRLRVDVDDIRAVNPRIVYARGTGQGTKGPEAETGGFDGTVYWGRAGMAIASSPPVLPLPLPMPSPGFGDLMSGLVLAAGITGALLHRERTGEAPIVDVSLLGVATWQMSPSVTAAGLFGAPEQKRFAREIQREPVGNPVVNIYRTKDDRFVQLVFLQSDRHWPELCAALGRSDLVDDPRFATAMRVPRTASSARRSSTVSSRRARSRSCGRSSRRRPASGPRSRRRRRCSTTRRCWPTGTSGRSTPSADRSRWSRTPSCSTRPSPTSSERRSWANTATRRCSSSATTGTRSSRSRRRVSSTDGGHRDDDHQRP